MVRITENSLIIEIPTGNTNPLEAMSNMQKGLIDLIGIIDYKEPESEIQNSLWHLRQLLKEMVLCPDQVNTLHNTISSNRELTKAFVA